MAAAADESPTRGRLALIIGNDDYSDLRNKRQHAVRNARALSDLLRTMDFNVDNTHTDIQTDVQMKRIVRDFAARITDGDLVLFYFSGHGCEFEDLNYLLPIDNVEIRTTRDVPDFAMNLKTTLELLVEKNTSYVTIFILDCCEPYWPRSNPTPSPLIKSSQLDVGALVQLIHSVDRVPDGIVEEGRKNLFHQHLLKNLNRENVSVVKLFKHIKHKTHQESNRTRWALIINELREHQHVCINEVIYSAVSVPSDAKWQTKGDTVAGARGHQSRHGSTLDRLHYPRGLFVTDDRAILVADTLNHRIMKYVRNTENGQLLAGKNMSGRGDDFLWAPSTVVFHQQSRSFIIADTDNRRVIRRTRGPNAHVETVIENIDCFGLAVDDQGSIYVSDTKNHLVRRFPMGSTRGVVVAGGHGEGPRLCQLHHPTYIFVAKNKSIFVSDSYNDRVMKWNEGANEGEVVAGGNGKGKDPAQLNRPAGVIVDRLGAVYVADYYNNRVMRWRAGEEEGEIIVGAASKYLPGDETDELHDPEGLAFDKDGNLYVADAYNHRVQRFAIRRN